MHGPELWATRGAAPSGAWFRPGFEVDRMMLRAAIMQYCSIYGITAGDRWGLLAAAACRLDLAARPPGGQAFESPDLAWRPHIEAWSPGAALAATASTPEPSAHWGQALATVAAACLPVLANRRQNAPGDRPAPQDHRLLVTTHEQASPQGVWTQSCIPCSAGAKLPTVCGRLCGVNNRRVTMPAAGSETC